MIRTVLILVCFFNLSQSLYARPNKPKSENPTTADPYVVPMAFPVHCAEPEYPELMAKGCLSCDVEIEMFLDRTGRATDCKVISCTHPFNGFEESAKAAVRKTRFLPLAYYTKNGFEGRARYTVRFRCINRMIPTTRKRPYPLETDTIPDPPESIKKDIGDEGMSLSVAFYPNDTSEGPSTMPEGDVYIKYCRSSLGQVLGERLVFTTFLDTMYDQIALNLIREEQFHSDIDLWERSPDSLFALVVFRRSPGKEVEKAKDTFVAVEVAPVMTYQEPLHYPREAKRANKQGTIWVRALVDKEGKVRRANILQSCGYPDLDSAAVECAYRYKYKPAQQNGKAVGLWVSYEVEFKLN
jgi:TonB family protein